jgi:hypothetical protein
MECPREGRTGRPFAELVCGGRLDLAEASWDISTDWFSHNFVRSILKVRSDVADNSISGRHWNAPYGKSMDSEQVRIAFSVEPDHCILRLEGALGVSNAEELRQTALELCAYRKDVKVDWSGAYANRCRIAQVLLSLRAGLGEQNRSLGHCETIPPPIQELA